MNLPPAATGRPGRVHALIVRLHGALAAAESQSFDLDQIAPADLVEPVRPLALYELDDLGRILARPELLPPGLSAEPQSNRQFRYSQPGFALPILVTTDPGLFDEHPESVELWSPGSPAFAIPDDAASPAELAANRAALNLCFRSPRAVS